jgi:putative sterol carrier protein
MAVDNAREVFEVHMPRRFGENLELSAKVNATYQFRLTGDGGGSWFVDLTRSPGTVRPVREETADAQCTITVAAHDFLEIVNGRLNGQRAFMTGKLKVAGEIGLAMRLTAVLGDPG